VRGWIAFAVLALSPVTASAKSSNPAFLGIGMHDAAGHGAGPCVVDTVTLGSGAQAAGLRPSDEFIAIDGTVVSTCDSLVTLVQAREPGEFIKVEVRRAGSPMTVKAELLSRGELLRRRFVGQIVQSVTLTRVDDGQEMGLANRGKTTIIGWYPPTCSGCDQVFGAIARWTREKAHGAVTTLAATPADPRKSIKDNLAEKKPAARNLDVPLVLADLADYEQFSIADQDRVHFMVIDCRGVVQYIAPIAPDGDDTSAVLDELYAAAEQAALRMK
jgi:membrane-associated protease RseP (regulator of RpoE activity)